MCDLLLSEEGVVMKKKMMFDLLLMDRCYYLVTWYFKIDKELSMCMKSKTVKKIILNEFY